MCYSLIKENASNLTRQWEENDSSDFERLYPALVEFFSREERNSLCLAVDVYFQASRQKQDIPWKKIISFDFRFQFVRRKVHEQKTNEPINIDTVETVFLDELGTRLGEVRSTFISQSYVRKSCRPSLIAEESKWKWKSRKQISGPNKPSRRPKSTFSDEGIFLSAELTEKSFLSTVDPIGLCRTAFRHLPTGHPKRCVHRNQHWQKRNWCELFYQLEFVQQNKIENKSTKKRNKQRWSALVTFFSAFEWFCFLFSLKRRTKLTGPTDIGRWLIRKDESP